MEGEEVEGDDDWEVALEALKELALSLEDEDGQAPASHTEWCGIYTSTKLPAPALAAVNIKLTKGRE